MGFILWSVLYTAILLAVCSPALFLAYRRSRRNTIIQFTRACAVGGVFCGVVAAGSQRLVDQCQAEGNPSCFDAGADGMIILLIAAFGVVSIFSTYFMVKD